MTVRRHFNCDLCHSEITDITEGIGIRWEFQRIKNVLVHDSEHHLCGKCCIDLQAMFADIQKTGNIRAKVDAEP